VYLTVILNKNLSMCYKEFPVQYSLLLLLFKSLSFKELINCFIMTNDYTCINYLFNNYTCLFSTSCAVGMIITCMLLCVLLSCHVMHSLYPSFSLSLHCCHWLFVFKHFTPLPMYLLTKSLCPVIKAGRIKCKMPFYVFLSVNLLIICNIALV